MFNRPTIVALTILFGAVLLCGSAPAQQAVPDAPQPQKKSAPKPPPPDRPAPAQTPGSDGNAFPEAVSKAAADAASEDKTHAAASPRVSPAPTSQDNPFPEDVSKAAAKAAGNEPEEPAPVKQDLPPGVSSSQATSADEAAAAEVPQDPALAKNDAQIGTYYLQTRDLRGALLRFQEATAADPTNVDAIYGLAETHRLMGKRVEAAREYQTYLAIVPHGGKSKEAAKELRALQAK